MRMLYRALSAHTRALSILAVFAVTTLLASSEAFAACPPGKSTSPDTAGNCCWPGQAWSGSACVGEPTSCPDGFGFTEDGQGCELLACEPGLQRTADGVHCCWPGQGWSSARGECVGEPQCEPGWLVEDNGCVMGPTLLDADNDTISDADDQCPREPEDHDGFQDDDGCPEADNDGDAVADADDQCPDEPEDFDDFHDDDGCPEADNDGDGLADADDQCPNLPEEMADRGSADADGCPNDDDRDRIANADDRCPAAKEDYDGFEDGDGCPELDNDGDGISDVSDDCASQPEDYDLIADADGCPDPDDDGDGVADGLDACPHQAEDGFGSTASDGCVVMAEERYGFHPLGAEGLRLQGSMGFASAPSSAGDQIFITYSGNLMYRWFVFGASLGAGGMEKNDYRRFKRAESDYFEDRDPREPDPALLAEGHVALNLLDWPNPEMNDFTWLNLNAGVHATGYSHQLGEGQTGTGLYLANFVSYKWATVGLEYRGFEFGSDLDDHDFGSVTLHLGVMARP